MMFTSRTAESFDPEPWEYTDDEGRASRHGERVANALGMAEHKPRPHFEPTRDPEPWVGRSPVTGDLVRTAVKPTGLDFHWSPRGDWHEYARPEPNPILVAFREGWGNVAYDGPLDQITSWLAALKGTERTIKRRGYPLGSDATPEQITHARKVLTRLAVLA